MAIPRAFALGGIAGPVLFGLTVFVSGQLRPEYSHWSQFMSELGETGSRTQTLMNFVGFLPSAFLILLSSLALLSRLRASWTGILGALCVSIFAGGMFASGLFPCDVSCMPDAPSRSQRLHNVAGMVADPALVVAPFILAFRFRRLKVWRPMFSYSLATSGLSFCALIAIGWSLPERTGTGLFQRGVLGLQFLWLGVVSWRLWVSAGREEAV
jgi:hypothetical protein